jgi:hypothetical protein
MWDSRRILKDLADAKRRQQILMAFWKHAEPHAKAMAVARLAKAMRFRDESIRKLSPEKKAEYLGARAGVAEFEEYVELALMQYHTHQANEMMAAYLDSWSVPHANGEIESDDYKVPSADQVRETVTQLADRFDPRDTAIYLATAGLLMGDEWRNATWPVVDEIAKGLEE